MNEERLMKVLISPHISEKATRAAEKENQFVFRVATDATKPEIKQAVELMFKVEVEGVQIANMRGKMKYGRHMGKRANWKKAYVRLKPGHDISFMGAE